MFHLPESLTVNLGYGMKCQLKMEVAIGDVPDQELFKTPDISGSQEQQSKDPQQTIADLDSIIEQLFPAEQTMMSTLTLSDNTLT